MDLLMDTHGLLLDCMLATTTEPPQSLISFLKLQVHMEFHLGSVVTMELKTLQLLHGWSMPMAVNMDHTFGAGMCAVSPESFYS